MNTIKIVLSLLVVVAAASGLDLSSLFTLQERGQLYKFGWQCFYTDPDVDSGPVLECAEEALESADFETLKENSVTDFMGCKFTGIGSLTACYKKTVMSVYEGLDECEAQYDAFTPKLENCFWGKVQENENLWGIIKPYLSAE